MDSFVTTWTQNFPIKTETCSLKLPILIHSSKYVHIIFEYSVLLRSFNKLFTGNVYSYERKQRARLFHCLKGV